MKLYFKQKAGHTWNQPFYSLSLTVKTDRFYVPSSHIVFHLFTKMGFIMTFSSMWIM
jgi:hypothetical protein